VQAEVKAVLAQSMPRPAFQLRGVRALPAHAAEHMELQADYATSVRDDTAAEDAVRTLSQHPGVTSVRWGIANEPASDWSR
jgi:putative Mg2+ transporter-C (MgtC) family protein